MPRKIARYGWRRDKLDRRDKKFLSPPGPPTPQVVDWTDKFPAVYNQGQTGTCGPNSMAGVIQYLQGVQGEPLVMPSRLFIYWNTEDMEGTAGTDSGVENRDMIKAVNSLGFCPESEWEFDLGNIPKKPSDQCYADAKKELLLDYQSVDNSNLQALLSAIAIGPVLAGFTVYESFETDAVALTGDVPMPDTSEDPIGGHDIVIIGYDQGTNKFKCRNSWGRLWSPLLQGNFHMPFEYLTNPELADSFWLCRRIT